MIATSSRVAKRRSDRRTTSPSISVSGGKMNLCREYALVSRRKSKDSISLKLKHLLLNSSSTQSTASHQSQPRASGSS